MLNKAVKKLKQTAAFTLGEALVATIILLLVTVVVVAGIPAAINAYNNVVKAANAEMLTSTAMGELRNELSTARYITVENNEITFYNDATGFNSKIYVENGDIMYNRYYSNKKDEEDATFVDAGTEGTVGEAERLVSEAASDKKLDLHVSYGGVTYSNGVIRFTNIKVTDKNNKGTGTETERYLIRVISD